MDAAAEVEDSEEAAAATPLRPRAGAGAGTGAGADTGFSADTDAGDVENLLAAVQVRASVQARPVHSTSVPSRAWRSPSLAVVWPPHFVHGLTGAVQENSTENTGTKRHELVAFDQCHKRANVVSYQDYLQLNSSPWRCLKAFAWTAAQAWPPWAQHAYSGPVPPAVAQSLLAGRKMTGSGSMANVKYGGKWQRMSALPPAALRPNLLLWCPGAAQPPRMLAAPRGSVGKPCPCRSPSSSVPDANTGGAFLHPVVWVFPTRPTSI